MQFNIWTSISVIQYINKIMKKPHMIILIVAEKAFEKLWKFKYCTESENQNGCTGTECV